MSDVIRYSSTETAKLVRLKLREKFPGVKFGVRTKKYSGGSSIRVKWMDGPTTKEVDSVIQYFEGATFDGMIDLKSYVTKEDENGNKIRFGADYVNTDRSYSEKFLQDLLKQHPTDNVVIRPPTEYSGVWFDRVGEWSRTKQEDIEYLMRLASDTSADDMEQLVVEDPADYSPDVTIGEWKGHPTITLPLDDKGFSFGVRKAQLILTYLEDIQKFVNENS